MHILIATTGALAPEPVARLSRRLTGDDGTVSVITIIEVPRTFLDELRSEEWHPLDDEATWGLPEEAVIGRYVEERGRRLVDPLVVELRASGMEPDVHFLEGEDPAATIIEAADKFRADVIVLGATKPIFDEASWKSVSGHVAQDGRWPVLIIPALPRAVDDESSIPEP